MVKEKLPGYLQTDSSCNSNVISDVNNEFNRLQNSKSLSSRFQLFSPYTNSTLSDNNNKTVIISQQELDMRRKAEILKYNKNSFTNGKFTNKQNFSRLMRNNKNVQTQFANCSNNETLPTLTSSSDVPGPIINLQLNNDTPLYNYESNRNIYTLTNEDQNFKWNYFTNSNITANNNIETVLYRLTVGQDNLSINTFNFNFSVGIDIVGDLSNNINTCDLSFNNFELSVFFNNSKLSKTYNDNFNIVNGNLSFDISNNLTNTNNQTFKISQYLFNINIDNLELATEYGFVYEIKCKFDLNLNFSNYTPNNLNSKIIMNIDQNNSENISNILFNGYSPNSIQPFFIYSNQ